MGSSAQNSSGVHWCRRGVRFNEVPENVPKVPEKVWEVLVQSQVMFNRVPEKVPKVWEALVQSQVRFNRVPEKVPEKAPGSLGSEKVPEKVGEASVQSQVPEKIWEALLQSQVRFNEGSGGSGEGSGGFGAEPGEVQQAPKKVPEKVWEASVQPGQVQQGPEKARSGPTGSREVPEKAWEALAESQVGLAWFSRICGLSIHGNQAGVYRALLRSAAHFRKMGKNATFRLLGIPPKLTRANQSLSSSRGCECTFGGSTVICPGMLWACTRAYCVHRRWC